MRVMEIMSAMLVRDVSGCSPSTIRPAVELLRGVCLGRIGVGGVEIDAALTKIVSDGYDRCWRVQCLSLIDVYILMLVHECALTITKGRHHIRRCHVQVLSSLEKTPVL